MGDYKNMRGGLRLATIKQLPNLEGYRCFTEAALRHLVFNSQDRFSSNGGKIPGNGMASAIVRIGRRVLIDLDEFDRWLDRHRSQLVSE